MTESVTEVLTKELQDELNKLSAQVPRDDSAKKIFVAVPNMGSLNIGLVMKLFMWAQDPRYKAWYHWAIEKRPTDFARNYLVAEFLKTDCQYLAMIDSDNDPHRDFLTLTEHEKDIIGATTHCWMGDKLVPSVWQRAKCEQCFCVQKYIDEGVVHDPTQYVASDGYLWRWEPEHQEFRRFAKRSGILGGLKCRCEGKGLDPWVYQTWQTAFEPGTLVNCDSLGAASIIISRRVIEKMPAPHFQFYYKPTREILMTEDHYFCWKAKVLGFEVWGDLEMTCGHYKTVNLAAVGQLLINTWNGAIDWYRGECEKQKIIVPDQETIEKIVKGGMQPTLELVKK